MGLAPVSSTYKLLKYTPEAVLQSSLVFYPHAVMIISSNPRNLAYLDQDRGGDNGFR